MVIKHSSEWWQKKDDYHHRKCQSEIWAVLRFLHPKSNLPTIIHNKPVPFMVKMPWKKSSVQVVRYVQDRQSDLDHEQGNDLHNSFLIPDKNVLHYSFDLGRQIIQNSGFSK